MIAKPMIGMVSPLSPKGAGIVDYNHALLKAMSRFAKIDVYCEAADKEEPIGIEDVAVRDLSRFEEYWEQGYYDAVIYQMGNNRQHMSSYELALKYPGVVILHDYEIRGSCEGEASNDRCLARLVRSAKAMVVHNEHSREVLAEYFPRTPFYRIHHLQSDEWDSRDAEAIQAMRRQLGMPQKRFMLCCMGRMQPHKRLESAIDVVGALVREGYDVGMSIVGDRILDDYGSQLESRISENRLRRRIEIVGPVDEKDFWKYIWSSDAAINLRYPSRGETSGSLIRILDMGLPCLVSAFEQYLEFPSDAVGLVSFERE